MNIPATPRPPRDVCPTCKQVTTQHSFLTPDGQPVSTWHCRIHGDVAPMRSVIVNDSLDWSAA